MGATSISWTSSVDNEGNVHPGYTFNPWWGCVQISPGCDRCYAKAFDRRTGGDHWGPRAAYRTFGQEYWDAPLRWDRLAARAGGRRRVFCASMADVFDTRGPAAERERLWPLVRSTPHLDWLLLTKRPQNAAALLPADWGAGYPNVWLGATVENRAEARRRLPPLRAVPAVVRFLSCEPLLEDVAEAIDMDGIHWAIAGGESGNGARPYSPEWPRALMALCRASGAAFFHKQAGSRREGWTGTTGKGENPAEWPGDLRVRRFPR